MSHLPKALFALFWIVGAVAEAQEPAPGKASSPLAAVEPSTSQSEMQKWLLDLDDKWSETLIRDITGPADAEVAKLRQKNAALIEANLVKASAAGDLETALAWRSEKEKFAANQKAPSADDPSLPADPALPAAIRQFQTEWRAEEAKLNRDRSDKTRALLARLDLVFNQAKELLTQHGRLDDAALVKARRDEVAARWLSGSPLRPPVKPPENVVAGIEAKDKPMAAGGMVSFASVDLEEGNFLPLTKGEKIWSDRNVRITRISPKFEGLGFTQHKAHGLTLKFKVLSDGLLYLGCSARWGTTAAPEAAKDFVTEQKLQEAGWIRLPDDEIATEASDMLFLMFSRQCKAGEEFSYRTEKYAPPILLWK